MANFQIKLVTGTLNLCWPDKYQLDQIVTSVLLCPYVVFYFGPYTLIYSYPEPVVCSPCAVSMLAHWWVSKEEIHWCTKRKKIMDDHRVPIKGISRGTFKFCQFPPNLIHLWVFGYWYVNMYVSSIELDDCFAIPNRHKYLLAHNSSNKYAQLIIKVWNLKCQLLQC